MRSVVVYTLIGRLYIPVLPGTVKIVSPLNLLHLANLYYVYDAVTICIIRC